MDAPLGFVANTDYDWYRYLHERFLGPEPPDEVNFWRPSGTKDFHAVRPGAPFFFKLKVPHLAIAGFGFFARASRVPLSIAWDAFREKNGAATFEEFRARLLRLRHQPLARGDDPVIGCLMICEPIFFAPRDWVQPPADWPKNLQSGKTYRVGEGEGRRLLDQCLARGRTVVAAGRGHGLLGGEEIDRFGAPALRRPRLGQGTFRVAVTDAYERCCAVSEEHSLPVLDAAHIKPYGGEHGGAHELNNGLLLRADIHRLFDRGYVTVTPNLRFRVSGRLRADWGNGRSYDRYRDQPVRVPKSSAERPDPQLLDWHARNVFLA